MGGRGRRTKANGGIRRHGTIFSSNPWIVDRARNRAWNAEHGVCRHPRSSHLPFLVCVRYLLSTLFASLKLVDIRWTCSRFFFSFFLNRLVSPLGLRLVLLRSLLKPTPSTNVTYRLSWPIAAPGCGTIPPAVEIGLCFFFGTVDLLPEDLPFSPPGRLRSALFP